MRISGLASRAAGSAALLLFAGASADIAGFAAQAEAAQGAETAALERLELMTAAGPKTIEVEVAMTPQQQALGLMYRTHLADDRGMLFPYAEARNLTMWMRNTYIPLDMVFIRADGTVYRIETRTEPLSERVISAGAPVTAVLELAGGAAERLGIRPGDKVRHPHFKNGTP